MPRKPVSSGALSFPPPGLGDRPLDAEVIPEGETLFRIHRTTHDPLWFGPGTGNPPSSRFDAPGGEYGVCYLGTTREACFVETFLRRPPVRLISLSDLAARSLALVYVKRPLHLVPLHGPGLARVGATAEVSSGGYALSMAWSLALWQHPSAPDGIVYRCRHDDSHLAVALFDRAAHAVDPFGSDPLHPSHDALLGRLARTYHFGLVP